MPESSPLAQFSDALADLVRHVGPSIVRVEARRRGNASGIAWSSDGLVLASDHTVRRDDNLRVGLPSGEVVPAELLGRDPSTDLALLRTGARLSPPEWSEAAALAVGHLVLSVGRHDDEAQTALGVVARRGGSWRTGTGGRVEAFIQTDITVYPGFSGSALVDARGRVAGMNTSHFGRRASLTLPAETLRRVANALSEHGRVRHGYLGVTTQPVRLRGEEDRVGLLVLDVLPDGPAEAAGVLVGDILTGLGDDSVSDPHELLAALAEAGGQTKMLHLLRGGEPRSLTLDIAYR